MIKKQENYKNIMATKGNATKEKRITSCIISEKRKRKENTTIR
jgi:hypothetical protein